MKLISRLLLISVIISVFLGCGGGSAGTDGGELVTIKGQVFSSDSTPLTGLSVSDLYSGNETQVSLDGSFNIQAEKRSEQLKLIFADFEHSTAISIDVQDSSATEIELTFKLEVSDFSIQVISPPSGESPKPNAPSTNISGFSNISGRVTDKTGSPVKEATISLGATEVKDNTDDQGRFSIKYSSRAGDLKILLRKGKAQAETTLINLPKGDLEIKLTLVVDEIIQYGGKIPKDIRPSFTQLGVENLGVVSK